MTARATGKKGGLRGRPAPEFSRLPLKARGERENVAPKVPDPSSRTRADEDSATGAKALGDSGTVKVYEADAGSGTLKEAEPTKWRAATGSRQTG